MNSRALSQNTANELHAQSPGSLVEQRHYAVRYEAALELVEVGVANAHGIALNQLAPGLWSGKKPATPYSFLEVTVRAQPLNDGPNRGTLVEISIEHRSTTLGVCMNALAIASLFLLIPIIPLIALGVRAARQQKRERLIAMQNTWAELNRALGAPQRAGYRRRPQSSYVRVAADDSNQDAVELSAEAASIEAARSGSE